MCTHVLQLYLSKSKEGMAYMAYLVTSFNSLKENIMFESLD